MSFESTLVNVGLLVAVIGMAVVVYVVVKFRDGEINEQPGDLQFSNMKNIPGQDYVDLNVVKVGKTKTLASFSSSGFISWEAFFNPKTQEDMEKRKPATMALVVVYTVFTVMGGMMKLLDIPIGVYFVGCMLVLLSLLVIVKFIQHGLRN
jgi:hypothetical protein